MSDPPAQTEAECPHCGGAVAYAYDPAIESLVCPHCGTSFAPDDSDDDSKSADPELDELRIRQQATLRRALYRSRSHAVIIAVACVVAAAEAARVGYHSARGGAVGWAIGCGIIVIGGVVGTIYAYRRALLLHREAQQSNVPAPTGPPDFSTLGDGSQQWQKLHDVK